MILSDIYAVNTSFINTKQGNRAENTCIRQVCPPIPAEHVMRFSQMHKSFVCIFVPHCLEHLKRFRYPFVGRMEIYLQFIVFILQVFFHIEFPYAVRIERFPQFPAIEHNVRNCIQAVKTQEHTVFCQHFLRAVEMAYILVIFLHQLYCLVLVILPERVIHPFIAQHIGVNSARNNRIIPLRPANLAHLPVLVQKLPFHVFPPSFLLSQIIRLQTVH